MPSKLLISQSGAKKCSQLKIDNQNGIIFSSSITPISGTVAIESENKPTYEILILDKNSNEIFRTPIKANKSASSETPFTWDLKSKTNSYVKSGCYTVSLIDATNELEKIQCCSVQCRVVDTRNILSLTRSLKHSPVTNPKNQALLSIYLEIIEDVECLILDRLRNNEFEEPYFIACTTACFIQEIADDIQNQTTSRFLDRIAEFQSKHPMTEKQMMTAKLGLWTVYDFLVNYMSDLEDHSRANAMARCGQCHLTRNDKAQIVSSLVLGIYPHSKT